MRCVKTVSIPHISLRRDSDRYAKMRTGLLQVKQIFELERVPAIRREMTDYLLELVDEPQLQRVSGNPSLMTALFWSASITPESCHLRLDVRCPIGSVECDGFLEIVCQRIENGRLVETKTLQPEFVNIPPGYPKWRDRTRLTAALSRKQLNGGFWRFRAVEKLKTVRRGQANRSNLRSNLRMLQSSTTEQRSITPANQWSCSLILVYPKKLAPAAFTNVSSAKQTASASSSEQIM